MSNKENAILFIDEIHMLVGAGSTTNGTMDASTLLKPALQAGAQPTEHLHMLNTSKLLAKTGPWQDVSR